MTAGLETEVERYADATAFAREVNLPLLASARLPVIRAGLDLSALLAVEAPPEICAVVDRLAETRRSVTLRSILLAGFPHDPELFTVGLALARAWSRRGVRVALVDLAFDHPTFARTPPAPAEGFVDMLLYGCSFRRVAWEIVAESLWLVGAGTHPPEEEGLAEHPDWDRTLRAFASSADVALFVAPLLDRAGVTGQISKRMDGALLVASVERAGRGALRDAFLELWGSDAPMIGCVGIESGAAPAEPPPSDAPPAEPPPSDAAPAEPPPSDAARAEDATALVARAPEDIVSAEDAPGPILSSYERSRETSEEVGESSETLAPEDDRLLAELTEELLQGRDPARRFPVGAVLGTAAVAASAGAVLLLIGTLRDPGIPPGALENTTPTGLPPVLSAPPAPPVSGGVGRMFGATLPPATLAEARYAVQVASSRSEQAVQAIVRDLAQRGADAWYEPSTGRPGWHRVCVGRFRTEEEAKSYAAWILGQRWVDQAIPVPVTKR